MSEMKKAATRFYACIGLFLLLVVYPLSIGPYHFLDTKLGYPHWMAVVFYVYKPLLWVLDRCPDPVGVWFDNYCSWCVLLTTRI
jgi:hypothetical protein